MELVSNFNVLAGSVWINAHALSPAAPEDRYVGMKVKGGPISLTTTPFLQGEQVTVVAATNINVSLQLDQRTDDDAAVESATEKMQELRNINCPKHGIF